MDLPGSSVHGISQARLLERVAIFFSRVSSRPRDWTYISCLAGEFFYHWGIGEVLLRLLEWNNKIIDESLLIKVKVKSEKVGLKLNIQKTKIMTSGPITSWEIDEETESDFMFLGSKITADGDCSHEIKRRLLLGRKVMTNLDSIFKSRDITLPTKVGLVKAMVFPVIMYGCESWTVKKAERRRIDALELWCWRRLLRVPWTEGDPTSPFWRRSALGILWKEWC